MGLLDTLGGLAGGGDAGRDASLLPAILNQLAKYPGGIAGLIGAFERGGLAAIVQSWIGSGANQPVSPQQLDTVLDAGVVDGIAQESGQDRGSVLDGLARLLPGLVDQATPDGNAQDARAFDAGGLMGTLGKLIG